MSLSNSERARRAGFERGAARWSAVSLSYQDFRAHLDRLGWTERLPPHVEDVYLCAACFGGDPIAHRALEDHHFSDLQAIIRRIDARKDFLDEVLQSVRVRLLSGESPKIGTYRGRGPLDRWLRTVATHLAFRLRGKPAAGGIERLCSPGSDGSLLGADQPFRARYARAVECALRKACLSLDARGRAVLRLYFCKGLNIDEIGRIYAVDRSTAARWIKARRESLAASVRGCLEAELGHIGQSEFDSLVGLVYDDLDVSVTQLLRSTLSLSEAAAEAAADSPPSSLA